jgi:hypothetical protein
MRPSELGLRRRSKREGWRIGWPEHQLTSFGMRNLGLLWLWMTTRWSAAQDEPDDHYNRYGDPKAYQEHLAERSRLPPGPGL